MDVRHREGLIGPLNFPAFFRCSSREVLGCGLTFFDLLDHLFEGFNGYGFVTVFCVC